MLSEENWNALADFTHDFCKKTEKKYKGDTTKDYPEQKTEFPQNWRVKGIL